MKQKTAGASVKRGRPKKIQDNSAEQKKLTYEQKKELKLKAQREKMAEKHEEPANKDQFYCTNKEMLAEMIKWRDSDPKPENRIISDKLANMMIAISQKVLNRSEFRNYPKALKEDMASFGHYKLIRGLKGFDFRFTNAFSFVTTAYFNAYLTVLKKHYKHINIKKELLVKLLSEMETCPGINTASALSNCIRQYIDDAQDQQDE